MRRYCWCGVPLLGLTVLVTGVLWTTRPEEADAHCQVPCGIYDDVARINQLREDATTIAKAITQINGLTGTPDAQSLNQASRWIATKDKHASHIINVVSQYFLTQKVKPVKAGAGGYETYLKTLADHHAVMVAAMKTKQNADPQFVDGLRRAIDGLAAHYKQ